MGYLEDFVAEAEKDNREGDHQATVLKCEGKTWPSGDPFWNLVVALDTANGAKADCTLNPMPSENELATIKAEGDRKKMRAVASGISKLQQLEKHYGITDPARLTEGMKIGVKTVKTKVDPLSGKGGFIRIIAFIPLGKKVAESNSDIPF